MSLFTGMAILEERFATAYFRFNDDAATELQPDLEQRPTIKKSSLNGGERRRKIWQARCDEAVDDFQPDASGEWRIAFRARLRISASR